MPGEERPLRITLVHPFTLDEVPRGGERYLDDLVRFLRDSGHDVEVLTGTHESPWTELRDGVVVRRRHHRLNRRLGRFGFSTSDLFGIAAAGHLVRHRVDIVHALVPSAALAARATLQRTVWTVLGHPTPDQFGHRPGDLAMFVAAARAVNAVAAYSGASAERVRRTSGVPAHVLTPGVHREEFRPHLDPRTGPPRLLFCSDAAQPRKRLDLLLRAFALVLDDHPDARLLVAGPGDPSWALAGLGPDRERVAASVDVIGPAWGADVAARYRDATLTVLPSVNEAFGIVLVESLASGTPVVCTDDGGMPEIASTPSVGRVFARDGSPRDLAVALRETIALAADPHTPRACSEHARRWDWTERVGPAHVAVYRRVLARPRWARAAP